MLNIARDLAGKYGHKLIYLSIFGSHLYGTDSPESDRDYRGIFLPSKESLLLGERCKLLSITPNKDDGQRNTKDDIDINLWSLQYWLELLAKGDTNAIDLLFSMTAHHSSPIFFDSHFSAKMSYRPQASFLDIRNNKAYISYAYQQAKKYGLKGSRMGIIKGIIEHIENIGLDPVCKSAGLFPQIVSKFGDPSYCFVKEHPDTAPDLLYICGKGFQGSISIAEMLSRLKREYETYGHRAILAQSNEGIDWKAISHAMRCIIQMIELVKTERIVYPLTDAPMLKRIKFGEIPWSECERMIQCGLDKIDKLVACTPENKHMRNVHRSIVLGMYN